MRSAIHSHSILLISAMCGLVPTIASARQQAPAPTSVTSTVSPHRANLARLTRPITMDFQEKRLEDIVQFIATSSGADLEPLWIDDRHPEGLDKDKVISVKTENTSILTLIEKVLEKAKNDTGDNSWQMAESGAVQIGPKSRLNQNKRVEIYDVNDLLLEVQNYRDVPKIDLQQALQSSQGGGGGGGRSPFRNNNEQNRDRAQEAQEKRERANELIQLLQSIVEPDQWTENGGSGGSIRLYNGTLIVNAADYMHRNINGYRYWPAKVTIASLIDGKRHIALRPDPALDRLLDKTAASNPPGAESKKPEPSRK